MIAAEGDEESEEDKVTSTSDRFLKRISDLPDNEKESLCLFAYPDGTWQVKMPSEQVPTELPEPSLGINSAWDGMERKQWPFLVANHSYSWLLALASYFASRSGFQKNERKKLFQMINDLPTIYEVVEMKQKEPSGSPKRTRSKSSKKTV